MDVAGEIAVSSLRVSQNNTNLPGDSEVVREGLPEDGEADVDEEIGAASGDEKDTEGWDCCIRVESAWGGTRIGFCEGREDEEEEEEEEEKAY